MIKRLNKIFKKSKRLVIDDNTKIVIMSDCHRGNGDNYDNFLKNKNIYEAALNYYYDNNYTYIELGDGDDMWEVKNYSEIIEAYEDIFKKFKEFYEKNRLIMIYGNHDIVKRSKKILKNIEVYESLVLNYNNYEIFLIHGHQVDFLNSIIWRISRFLVRTLWKIYEFLGINDFSGPAKNYEVKTRIEKRLKKWSIKNNKILIAGHTHRAIFPKIGQSLYFNDGSCIHPNGITCLEIVKGNIALVKWEFKVSKKGIIYVSRKLLEKRELLINFFR